MQAIAVKTGLVNGSTGSAYVEHLGSKVFAAVYGPEDLPTQSDPSTSALIETVVEDAFEKEAKLGELQAKLLHIYSAVINERLYLKTRIGIHFTFVQRGEFFQDAAVLAGSLALMDAGIAVKDVVLSVTVAMDENRLFCPFILSDTYVRVGFMLSTREILETEVRGSLEPNELQEAVAVAEKSAGELIELVRQYFTQNIPM